MKLHTVEFNENFIEAHKLNYSIDCPVASSVYASYWLPIVGGYIHGICRSMRRHLCACGARHPMAIMRLHSRRDVASYIGVAEGESVVFDCMIQHAWLCRMSSDIPGAAVRQARFRLFQISPLPHAKWTTGLQN